MIAMAIPSPSPAPAAAAASASRIRFGQLLNLPNFLTLLRIFSIPVFLALLTKHRYTDALYVFGFSALTDAADGAVARLCDSRTELGAFLDPFADKLLLVSAFVVLTIENDIPPWLLGVVIIRDVVIVAGYLMVSFFTSQRIPVRPSLLGKMSTFMQLFCVIGALARAGIKWPEYWSALLYLTLAATALSGMQYAWRGLVLLNRQEPEMFE
jgi:cardiolipin synthase (CMP-forming)